MLATDLFPTGRCSTVNLSRWSNKGNHTLYEQSFRHTKSLALGLRFTRWRSRAPNLVMATNSTDEVAAAIEFTAAPTPPKPKPIDPLKNRVKTTISEEAIRLKDVKQEEFPEEYQENDHDEKLRSSLEYNEWNDTEEIPVIDFSRLHTDREGLCKQLADAATEWGFFQLVNHGLSLEFMQELESESLKYFELPVEAKERTNAEGPRSAYVGDQRNFRPASLRWAESLQLTGVESTKKMAGHVWPDGYTAFRDVANTYFTFVEETAKTLLELFAEGLGVATDYFSKHYNSNKAILMRYHYYPPCPHPKQTVGARTHTDGCGLTILYQDSVGGLQVHREGKWFGVRPIPGALVVNIGDMLHAWSNGRFQTLLHRAVVNKSSRRLSIAGFCNIDPTHALAAPEEIIDEGHPRLFKPIAFMDYLGVIQEQREKNRKDYFYGFMALDRFRVQQETAV